MHNVLSKLQSADALSIGQLASLACLLEVTAPKPGNVHRGADFEDLNYFDFAVSAVAIAPAMDAAANQPLGRVVRTAVEATRSLVGTNSNLGMILLLAPLAKVPRAIPLTSGVAAILAALTPEDASEVYAAIRNAAPGGLGNVEQDDVAGPAPDDLLTAMRAAAGRDSVARQYAEDFRQVFDCIVPWLAEGLDRQWALADTIVWAHLRAMREFPDTLIARKCGVEVAKRSAGLAATVLAAGSPGEDPYRHALADFDFWLRSDYHRRNPGTTADLITAGLFAALREGIIRPPYRLTF
jgi:triphosphoribosyl-dephospho-CoA synthase